MYSASVADNTNSFVSYQTFDIVTKTFATEKQNKLKR